MNPGNGFGRPRQDGGDIEGFPRFGYRDFQDRHGRALYPNFRLTRRLFIDGS
ncbi:MAG: hypothetical protein AB7P19_02325 [Nitrospira sp.]